MKASESADALRYHVFALEGRREETAAAPLLRPRHTRAKKKHRHAFVLPRLRRTARKRVTAGGDTDAL